MYFIVAETTYAFNLFRFDGDTRLLYSSTQYFPSRSARAGRKKPDYLLTARAGRKTPSYLLSARAGRKTSSYLLTCQSGS